MDKDKFRTLFKEGLITAEPSEMWVPQSSKDGVWKNHFTGQSGVPMHLGGGWMINESTFEIKQIGIGEMDFSAINIGSYISAVGASVVGDDEDMKQFNKYKLPSTELLEHTSVSPFKKSNTLPLRAALESTEFGEQTSRLSIPLGKGKDGKIHTIDIGEVGCILAAGQTGSGKSNFTEGVLILSLLYQNTPDDLQLILVDPKMVQFSQYKDIPHLLTPPVTTPDVAREAFDALLTEIDRRIGLFTNEGLNDIDEYSSKIQKLPFIMVVIDEVIDLFMVDGKYYEEAFINIAKYAKTTGVYLYMGTSRPTRDAYNANLLSHFPTRIAFTVASEYDSNTMLGESGAEQLSGNGDLLYRSGKDAPLIRVQSPFATDEDVMKVANFWRDSK